MAWIYGVPFIDFSLPIHFPIPPRFDHDITYTLQWFSYLSTVLDQQFKFRQSNGRGALCHLPRDARSFGGKSDQAHARATGVSTDGRINQSSNISRASRAQLLTSPTRGKAACAEWVDHKVEWLTEAINKSCTATRRDHTRRRRKRQSRLIVTTAATWKRECRDESWAGGLEIGAAQTGSSDGRHYCVHTKFDFFHGGQKSDDCKWIVFWGSTTFCIEQAK